MAVDYTKDQLNTVSKLQNICDTILNQIALAKLIVQEASDLGYGNGGAQAVTDGLLQTPQAGATSGPFPKLAAADVFASATWLSNLDAALNATSITTTGSGRTGYKALERMRP